jgi:hypothetical protein
MSFKTSFLVFLFSSIILSCSCETQHFYTEREMWYKARDIDSTIELVGIGNADASRRILCKDYGPHCIKRSGRRILVNMVELIVIGFESEQAARTEALRIGQWYGHNWVFDDVANEPVLQDFIIKAFQAKDAKKEWLEIEKSKNN